MASHLPSTSQALSEEEIEALLESQKNIRTKKKTQVDTKKFLSFISKAPYCESRQIETLDPERLDFLLRHFIVEIRKPDGSEYEPDTLTSYRNSIERFLRDKKYQHSLITAQEFKSHRDVLYAKRKQLRTDGLGRKPNARNSLTEADKEKLLKSNQLSMDSPATLMNLVWYNNSMHFGLRGFQEHYDLKWSDVELKETTDSKQFLEYGERVSKTRNGESGNDRKINPKAYATGTETCPVRAYLAYKEHRPSEMQLDDSPFYLAIIHKPCSEMWYKNSRMGHNKLQSVLKSMAENAGISTPNISNHSARKTLIRSLRDEQVPPTDIIQLTGHKRLESILSYDVLSEKNQENMSSLISKTVRKRDFETVKTSDASINSASTTSCSTKSTVPFAIVNLQSDQANSVSTSVSNSFPNIFAPGSVTSNKVNITFISGNCYNAGQMSPESKTKRYRRRIIESSDSSQD